MALSYKCAVISLLVVFSMAAPNPSAAAAAGKRSHTFLAPAPAPRGAPHAHPQFFLGCPSFPKILRDLCHALFPRPTPSPPHEEPLVCRSTLAARLVSPCAAFLTNSSVSAPSTGCCHNVRSFFGDGSTSPYCLCHVANGDIDPMLPAAVVDPARRVSMLVTCDPDVLNTDYVNRVCDKDSTYKKYVPPMDPPGPLPPPTPSPPDEPRVCRPSLAARLVSPCKAFLTNSSVSAPSIVCCDNVRSFFGDRSVSPFCLCHVANGDIDPMLPAPVVDPARRINMLVTCDSGLSTDVVNKVCDKDSTYRKYVPPMDPPSPPQAPGKKKA